MYIAHVTPFTSKWHIVEIIMCTYFQRFDKKPFRKRAENHILEILLIFYPKFYPPHRSAATHGTNYSGTDSLSSWAADYA